jgi:hypothetical protein
MFRANRILGERPLTPAEKQKRYRERQRVKAVNSQMLEVAASRIHEWVFTNASCGDEGAQALLGLDKYLTLENIGERCEDGYITITLPAPKIKSRKTKARAK